MSGFPTTLVELIRLLKSILVVVHAFSRLDFQSHVERQRRVVYDRDTDRNEVIETGGGYSITKVILSDNVQDTPISGAPRRKLTPEACTRHEYNDGVSKHRLSLRFVFRSICGRTPKLPGKCGLQKSKARVRGYRQSSQIPCRTAIRGNIRRPNFVSHTDYRKEANQRRGQCRPIRLSGTGVIVASTRTPRPPRRKCPKR